MSEEETQTPHHVTAVPSSASSSTNSTWFTTPSGLFLVLNFMIFTIALSSKLTKRRTRGTSSQNHQESDQEDDDEGISRDQDQEQESAETQQFSGTFQQFHYQHENFENLNHPNMSPPPPPPSPSPRFDSFNVYGGSESMEGTDSSSYEYELPRETERFQKPKKFRRVKSVKRPSRLRKSWSMRSDYGRSEKEEEDGESIEKRRPSTMRDQSKGDEEVDARADDFINRFKQQLKLQRSNSFARYREKKDG